MAFVFDVLPQLGHTRSFLLSTVVLTGVLSEFVKCSTASS